MVVEVVGLTADDVAKALRAYVSDIEVKIINDELDKMSLNENRITVMNKAKSDREEIAQLNQILRDKERQMREMDANTKIAVESIQTFHQQQQALYEEFLMLREKYDGQKDALVSALWTHCSPHHPELRFIPTEESDTFIENSNQVGNYEVGEPLGEGQFATVFSCADMRSKKELALKVINKDRVTFFSALKRVSNEIEILKKLSSQYVVQIKDVIHSKTKLYIVTEKGGSDLFNFFDEHPNGVPESWAYEIIVGLLDALLHCHKHMVCHRDLKPENILLVFDCNAAKLIDLKLCDFGLSTRYQNKQLFTDFCGSPGFFSPEMITRGSHLGDRVDVWSIGCIILELVLGHEKFCEVWMSAYDYEVMQDKEKFEEEISVNVKQLKDVLHFSADLNNFIISVLKINPENRLTVYQVCHLAWVSEHFDSYNFSEPAPPDSPALGRGDSAAGSGKKAGLMHYAVSNRERRLMEEYSKANGQTEINLPPIEPSTPDVGRARKILKKTDQLAKFASKAIVYDELAADNLLESASAPSTPDGNLSQPKRLAKENSSVSDTAF